MISNKVRLGPHLSQTLHQMLIFNSSAAATGPWPDNFSSRIERYRLRPASLVNFLGVKASEKVVVPGKCLDKYEYQQSIKGSHRICSSKETTSQWRSPV